MFTKSDKLMTQLSSLKEVVKFFSMEKKLEYFESNNKNKIIQIIKK
jgi:hypothetical protein